jgi:hypothetical protein
MDTLNITPERVKQAAQENPEAANTLKTLFPEVFKNEPFDFGRKYTICGSTGGTPLAIGMGLAPNGMEGKCLVLNEYFTMETMERCGVTILIFREK